jgi:DNA-binding NarL/FixJ family response regulator
MKLGGTEGTKMSEIAQLSPQVATRGRQLKFTPERIQQIKNLVERGKSREEIAELIGVTVGSLQVTCSRLGVSLRRLNVNSGTGPLWRDGGPPSLIGSRGQALSVVATVRCCS